MNRVSPKLIVRHGQIVSDLINDGKPTQADILIENGVIASIHTANEASLEAPQNAEIIDATDCWVLPAFIDLCHYIREPGYEAKGKIATETEAAAAAGFSHIICPPATQPVIDNPAIANLIQNLAEEAGYCHVYPLGAMTQGLLDEQLSEMHALKTAGCIGIYPGDHLKSDNRSLMRCIEYAATFDLPIYFRSSDASLSKGGIMHEGELSNRLGIPAIPACAETIAMARDLQIVEVIGVPAHFSRITCEGSVELIANAKAKGLNVTCDVSLQHLLFTDQTLADFNSLYLDHPPFRAEKDRHSLLTGLKEGIIDAICSNHQPHEISAKMAPLGESQPGLSTVDTFVPNLLQLMNRASFSPIEVSRLLSFNPATLLQKESSHLRSAPPCGTLKAGDRANLTIIDPTKKWVAQHETILSAGENIVRFGETFTGKVSHTIVDGSVTYRAKAES